MQVQQSGERVDVMHYHVNEGRWEGTWEDGHDMYKQILQVCSIDSKGCWHADFGRGRLHTVVLRATQPIAEGWCFSADRSQELYKPA